MAIKIEKARDVTELSMFLSRQNKQKKSHIGCCGEEEAEILQTLKAEFSCENRNFLF